MTRTRRLWLAAPLAFFLVAMTSSCSGGDKPAAAAPQVVTVVVTATPTNTAAATETTVATASPTAVPATSTPLPPTQRPAAVPPANTPIPPTALPTPTATPISTGATPPPKYSANTVMNSATATYSRCQRLTYASLTWLGDGRWHLYDYLDTSYGEAPFSAYFNESSGTWFLEDGPASCLR